MSGLIVVFLVWCCFAVPIGWGLAKIESRVNGAPMRTKNAILFSVFLGPIGWIWVAARSNMKFASGIRADLRAQGDAARQALEGHQQPSPPGPPSGQYPQQAPYPPQPPPPGPQYLPQDPPQLTPQWRQPPVPPENQQPQQPYPRSY